MCTRHVVPLLLALLLAGCTHRKIVDPAAVASFASLNKQAAHRQATVTLAGGGVHTARALQMTTDSTSWFDPKTETLMQVATDEVVAVRLVKHDRGALEGLVGGLLGGGVQGAMLGFVSGNDPPCEPGGWVCLRFTAKEKATFWGVLFGLSGGITGLFTGLIVGHRDEYRVRRPAPDDDVEGAAK